ncbi:DUF5107 domain-containing protein [Persicitalea sp.]|uniref:DUF5107 domain-containing protein n=1 Tax=Persicitalea sp. TaxID=3100273 RepID=UPI00359364FE
MTSNQQVRVWEEPITIPTYGVGEPNKNPMFLEKRVYQGSSGVVYPNAVIEKIDDHKEDQTYQAVYLENEYLKIMILPELGGRVQMAFDKVKNRHFVYYNQVIKPALVGLTGPWISGGIEFNWPQHHRPSTFEPIDFTTEEHEDGSKTIWVSEVERMFGTKGMAGFRLYPGKAYLEIQGVLYNRTEVPQTFLWWSNPAVKVNDYYQSVFPPDVHAVFDHGRRDVSEFPIAKGTYYKVDYSPGTDISRYKNIPVPTSYMAAESKYDFVGGYEHDSRGGILHVASHHLSPGKKQWTWGKGEFGYAWDRNLTDEDGPYIELMTGVFTDNQPDFSWIMPNEERTFVQYFMPYSEIGLVKNATKEAAVNLEISEKEVAISAYTTAAYPGVIVRLTDGERVVFEESLDLSPENPFLHTVSHAVSQPTAIRLSVTTAEGVELVAYQPDDTSVQPAIPEPAIAAKSPAEVENNEQLFLTGHHIEQYRHATYSPVDYYEEALRRDPKDSRCNNALGLWYYKHGQFTKAEPYFQTAILTLTARNPNPYDGEAYYNLGLCLTKLARYDEAFDAFYKATWNAAWQDTAFLELARIATRRKDYAQALELVERSLARNWHGHSARHLKVVLLRKIGRPAEAQRLINDTLAIDKFHFGCLFERLLVEQGKAETSWVPSQSGKVSGGVQSSGFKSHQNLKKLMRDYIHSYLEYALDYSRAGLYHEADCLLLQLVVSKPKIYSIVYYFLAFFYDRQGESDRSNTYLKKATEASPDFVFPNRLDELIVLQWAAGQEGYNHARTWYYLGNFWYGNRQYSEAIDAWERSTKLDDTFPTAFRNLSLAYQNKLQRSEDALKMLEKAFELNPTDARVLMELDQLDKKMNHAPAERLARLEKYSAATEQRDDLHLERITLCNQLERYQTAQTLLAARQFHPWEGGEGKVVRQHLICHIELAKQALLADKPAEALDLLTAAETYPLNLGEGKLYGVQENDIFYLKGLAHEALAENDNAEVFFRQATDGLDAPVQAIFYNDQQPDKLFYQGLGWRKLHQNERAEKLFSKLIEYGEAHLDDEIKLDYFAVSLPDMLVFDNDLNELNKMHCYYLIALGNLGLGNGRTPQAVAYFDKVLGMNVNHQGALIHRNMINFLQTEEMAD